MTTDTKIDQYTLSKEDDVFFLKKNEHICSCPFRNPTILPHPTIQGQMIINNPLCTSRCQFFKLEDNVLFLSCSKSSILIEKEKKSDNSRLQDTKILSL